MIPTDETPVIFSDRVQSLNYVAPGLGETFARSGTLINLADGSITSTGLTVDGVSGELDVAGALTGTGSFTLLDAGGDVAAEWAEGGFYSAWGTAAGELTFNHKASPFAWESSLAWDDGAAGHTVSLNVPTVPASTRSTFYMRRSSTGDDEATVLARTQTGFRSAFLSLNAQDVFGGISSARLSAETGSIRAAFEAVPFGDGAFIQVTDPNTGNPAGKIQLRTETIEVLAPTVIDTDENEALELRPGGSTTGRPYVGFYAHDGTQIVRSGLLGFPGVPSGGMQVFADRGDVTVTANAYPSAIVLRARGGGGTLGSVNIRGDSSDRVRIVTPGTYAATTAAAANLNIASSGTIQRSTSSARYKTDVRPMSALEARRALELRPVRYRSTSDVDNPAHSYYGFIAEQVAVVDPRLVHWSDDGNPEGVQYDRLTAHLVCLVADLEGRLAALESTS